MLVLVGPVDAVGHLLKDPKQDPLGLAWELHQAVVTEEAAENSRDVGESEMGKKVSNYASPVKETRRLYFRHLLMSLTALIKSSLSRASARALKPAISLVDLTVTGQNGW